LGAVHYFAYDVTLNPEYLRRIIGRWSASVRALVRGYTLGFTTFLPSWGGGAADLVEREDGVVYGALYTIDERQLEALDRSMGVPHLYRRLPVVAETGGGRAEAVTYTAVKKRGHVPPSESYLSQMLKGLKYHGYPDEVLQGVRRIAGG